MGKMQYTKKRGDYIKCAGEAVLTKDAKASAAAKAARFLALAFVLLLVVLAAAPGTWAEEMGAKNIYLQPGDAYNADGAGNNTTVYMDKAGEYTLEGNSDNVRFIIKTGGVTVYLADGLYIDPGTFANNGNSASAISIQHKSGNVTLISKEDASIYFGSHSRAPAIHQDGTDGTLIFATENPSKPGKIVAKSAALSESAAIGSGKQKGTTGNIVFNSGNVYATGDNYAAGIGGGNGGRARNITVNGGYVDARGGIFAAGIGSGMYEGAAYITVNGGEVIAKGGKGGAGIGSGLEIENTPIKGEDIKITGGKVEAVGGTGAAGIGGGRNADGEHIEISGGTVVAKGGELGGAGIGGGGWFDPGGYGGDSLIGGDGRYITISGGTVTATGRDDGAGIGGGNEEGNGENITISGGTVVASGGGDGAGIGGAWKGRAKDITITGGRVTANGSGGGAGIGGGSTARGRNLKISGGIVKANGGKNGDGIGGGKKPGIFSKDFTNSVFISGGTVIAAKGSKGSADIGGRGNSTVSISGGSVKASNNAIKKQAKNQAGDIVYETVVNFHNVRGEQKIDSLTFTSGTPKYETNDIYNIATSHCAIYLWLPKASGVGVDSGTLTEDDGTGKVTKKYTALEIESPATNPWIMKKTTIAPGTKGSMYPPNNIILDNGRNSEGGLNGIKPEDLQGINAEELAELKDGSATGEFMETKLGNFNPVSGSIPGMHIEGYSTSDNYVDYIIADAEGNLKANQECPRYVNDKSQWITATSQVKLYAVWRMNTYNVHFDSNKPAEATSEVEGEMPDQTGLSSQGPENLNANAYTLPGWRFKNWTTEPDGTGDAFADQDRIWEQVGHDETVTLYAQWERVKYTVSFDAGEGGIGTMDPQILEYDLPASLNTNLFTHSEKAFLGWSVGTLGHLYEDGASVVNLCSEKMEVDPDTGIGEGYTLTAQWHDANEDVVMVTLDGTPVDINNAELPGEYDGIGLRPTGSNQIDALEKQNQTIGLYTIEDRFPGEYDIMLKKAGTSEYEASGRTMKIVDDKCNVSALDYCTVDIEVEKGSENYGSAWLGGGLSNGTVTVLNGDKIEIHCKPNTGYRFIEYTVAGHAPIWDDGKDETEAEQTITVTGKTRITAHIEPIHYYVKFDANAPDTTGTMSDQEFVYGQQRDLFPNQYRKENYNFTGWDTETNGSGTKYRDGQPITEALTTTHDEIITLYAQWTPMSYTIHYDSNGADSGGWELDQRSFYSRSTPLQDVKSLGFGMPNYHFTSWNTRSGGDGTAYQAGQTVSNLAKGGETITLYAQWAHDSYTVHYDGNGGTGTMPDEEFWIDAYEPLHKSTFKKDGFTFTGWNTKRDGTGDAYGDREDVMNLAKAGESATLYAQWNQGSSDGSSKTGDVGSPWIPAILMMASLGIGAILFLRRRKI